MEDQGKRLLMAVALIMGVLFLWQTIFKPKDDDPAKQAQQQAEKQVQQQQVQQTAGPQNTQVHEEPAAAAIGDAQTITLPFKDVVVSFTSKGGTLASWKLTDPRYEHDITKGELLPDPSKFPDSGSLAVGFGNGSTYYTRAQLWTGQKLSDTTVQYTYSDDHLDVVKTFEVVPDAFMIKTTIKVAAKDDVQAHERLVLSVFEYQDPKTATTGTSRVQPRQWDSGTLRADGDNLTTPISSILEGGARYEPAIRWTGFEHPYLLVGYAPAPGGATIAKQTFAAPSGIMRTDIEYPDVSIAKAAPFETKLVGYLGPKNLHKLENADTIAGFAAGFDKTLDLGWFSIIGKPLLWLLLAFHSVLGNWGISIVLLTILVKLATLYWTTKSMRSMKAMAVLGPQLKALQEKYKDDKQRQQMETMALYKTHGVNPLAGCLPMLLQMPIWIALYRMLSNAGELYQQPFIRGWIDDLTASDPYYVLPIVLVVTMFAQARLTPTTVDPSQKLQQRMMQYGMPLMFGVMSFFFPAGLTLYIFTNTCLSAVHSIWMNKYDKKSLELAAKLKASKAAAEAAKTAPKVAQDDKKSDDAAPKEQRPRQGQRRKKGGRR